MDKEFVPYEEALALKELGFDEPCLNKFYTKPNSKMFGVDEKGRHYPIKNIAKRLYTIGEHFVLKDNNVIIAPLYQQAFRFFREKYKYLVSPFSTESEEGKVIYYFEIGKVDKFTVDIYSYDKSTYEEAEIACIRKLIEIVKRNL